MMRFALFLFIIASFASCNGKTKADMLVVNATIYKVDPGFNTATAMAISNGVIIETGTTEDLRKKYKATEELDAGGKFIYPGFIDAHAHFLGYGQALQTADLTGTTSWEQIVEKVKNFGEQHQEGWIIGRGWDQNDWLVKEFPDNTKLNELFPGRPVLLTRIDGHAAIANEAAIRAAGITAATKVEGGDIFFNKDKPTGLLVDNAIDLVSSKVPVSTTADLKKALLAAQQNCFAAGLTTIDDCGVSSTTVDLVKEMQKNGELKMRLYMMLSDSKPNFDYLAKNGVIKTDRLHVNGFKVYGDGALGSRGACLLHPYTDKPDQTGFLLSSAAHFDSVANWIFNNGFQMCTHAIGDSGNRSILNIYAKYLKGENDRRWRIEHAQVVNKNDFDLFGKYSVVPSVQPTHATSDMYWAGDRLGSERIKTAYAYKQLLQQNGWVALGTDFPVEDISPIKTFYAAVVRKDVKGWPDNGFQTENALTRQETLRGMTIWAAKSNFEEKEKGSLEAGKFADFVMLDKDLLTTSAGELLQVKVLQTFVNGERVFPVSH